MVLPRGLWKYAWQNHYKHTIIGCYYIVSFVCVFMFFFISMRKKKKSMKKNKTNMLLANPQKRKTETMKMNEMIDEIVSRFASNTDSFPQRQFLCACLDRCFQILLFLFFLFFVFFFALHCVTYSIAI